MSREVPLVMPKMSMTMESGELLEWTRQVGDEVKAGDVVAVVQTDKVDMEVESPVDGTLVRTVADPGAVIDVGRSLAFIATEAEDLMDGLLDPEPAGPATPPSDTAAVVRDANDDRLVATAPSRKGPRPAVPFARRRAALLRVSLDDVVGSGRGGVITVLDVERAAELASQVTVGALQTPTTATPVKEPAPPTPAAGRPHPAPGPADPGFADALAPRRRSVRSAVAKTMTRSAAIPQFTVFAELDLENLQRSRNGISWTTLLVRALARALRSEPQVLAGWDPEKDAPAAVPESCGVALATDTPVGLLAPVLRDPDLIPLGDLDGIVRATIDRARSGRLTLEDMQGATTTLSNLGGYRVPSFTSLLTPPQASALSVGSITQRPVVVHGGLAVRLGVTVGLTVDHRAVDGADAARVLDALRSLCERPDTLLT